MSNTLVGNVYQKIMDDVIENCVVTFEEDGVERKLLDEVKKTWQAKLSERKVALMPWDPAPALPPSAAPVPSNAAPAAPSTSRPQQQPSSESAPVPAAAASVPKPAAAATNGSAAQIKSEPGAGYDLQNLPQPNAQPNGITAGPNNEALARASQLMKDKFGSAASAQINQLQARVSLNEAGQSNQNQSRMPQATPQAVEEQRRKLYAQQQAQVGQQKMQNMQAQRQQQQGSVSNSQTDGAGDWREMVAQRRAAALEGASEADASIRQRVELMSAQMEGGGVMLPMSEIAKQKKRKTGHSSRPLAPMQELASAQVDTPSRLAQFDGGEDSDDDKSNAKDDDGDEDAINSDLDDPDDDVPEETEDDGNQGEIMLCTYDKVQRVKNKWKCTLKDGVLTTGGKEYVFHKAQGEFEW